MYNIFSLDFWLTEYHKTLDFFNVNKFSYRFLFPPSVSYVRLKNILKSPPSIILLQWKSLISCKRSQRVDIVCSCSDSLLALYSLISEKSLWLTFTSKIRILQHSYCFLFETSKLILPMKPIASPQELIWPFQKKSFLLNSLFHFFSSCMVECVSYKKNNSTRDDSIFQIFKNFCFLLKLLNSLNSVKLPTHEIPLQTFFSE